MMERLMERGLEAARKALSHEVAGVTERLRQTFGDAAVNVDGDRVIAGGRGIVRRWLDDPRLRFFGRGFE